MAIADGALDQFGDLDVPVAIVDRIDACAVCLVEVCMVRMYVCESMFVRLCLGMCLCL